MDVASFEQSLGPNIVGWLHNIDILPFFIEAINME